MELINTQLAKFSSRRAQQAGTTQGTSAAGTVSSNPFDAIIQAMVAEMLTGNSGNTTGTAALTDTGTDSSLWENNALLAGGSAMLNSQPNALLSLLMGSAGTTQGTSAAESSNGAAMQASLINALANASGTPAVSALLQNLTGSSANTQSNPYASLLGTTAQNGSFDSLKAESALTAIPVLEASLTTSANQNGISLDGYQNYAQIFQNIRQQLKDNEKTAAAVQPVSADSLQQSVNGANVEALIAQKSEAAQDSTLLSQISQGVKEHISLGDSEFTIKLKPESLGEISIKLVKAGEKMTLEIVTANAHTARLINSDLAALQDAVKPMQVEVHEAMTSHSGENSAQQWNSFNGQQYSGGQHSSGRSSQSSFSLYPSDTLTETETETPQLTDPNSTLSLYV